MSWSGSFIACGVDYRFEMGQILPQDEWEQMQDECGLSAFPANGQVCLFTGV